MSRDELRNVVTPFDGSGDVNAWMKKVRLVGKLKKIKDLAEFVPLYLEGQAFAIYDELDSSEKEDVLKIEAALRSAFEIDRYTAYERLQQRRWVPGEPADIFLSDLRRLAKLACVTDEEVIRGAFITGLPSDVSRQLRPSQKTATCKMSALCEQARILLQQKVSYEIAAAARDAPRRRYEQRVARQAGREGPVAKLRCFVCEGNHLARMCPKRADRRQITCWRCGEPGHVAAACPPGNDLGEEKRAPPSSPLQ
jgi:hypothetical protein